ncbi:SRPBCC domain-containing protein [Micromonospora zhanjiangensis]
MAEAAFVHEIDITTSPQRLWTALTAGTLTRFYWFDLRIESDWRVGSPVALYDGASDVLVAEGPIEESTPVRRLCYGLRQHPADGGPAEQPYGRVAFDLARRDRDQR